MIHNFIADVGNGEDFLKFFEQNDPVNKFSPAKV